MPLKIYTETGSIYILTDLGDGAFRVESPENRAGHRREPHPMRLDQAPQVGERLELTYLDRPGSVRITSRVVRIVE